MGKRTLMLTHSSYFENMLLEKLKFLSDFLARNKKTWYGFSFN